MSDDDINKVNKKIGFLGKDVVKKVNEIKRDDNNSDSKKKFSIKHSFSYFLPFLLYISLLIIFIYFTLIYINVGELIDLLLNLIISFIGFDLTKKIFLQFTVEAYLELFKDYIIICIYSLFIFIPLKIVSGKGYEEDNLSNKIMRFEVKLGVIFIVILFLLYFIPFSIFGDGNSPGIFDIGGEKISEAKDSYTLCVLSNLMNTQICDDKFKEQEAELSEKTKYKIEFKKPPILSYDIDEKIPVDYLILTKGGQITLDKFECYTESSEFPFTSIDLDGKVIKAENFEKQRRFYCDLSQIEDRDFEEKNDFRIRPVLYYKINTTITQEIPILNLGNNENNYQIKENLKSQYQRINPIFISNDVIKTTARIHPQLPIYLNDENKNYQLIFTMDESSSVSSLNLGNVIKYNLNSVSVPEIFEYDCTNKNPDCDELLEEKVYSLKSHLTLNLKLKDNIEVEDKVIEALELNIDSKMQRIGSFEIQLINPYYSEETEEEIEEVTT